MQVACGENKTQLAPSGSCRGFCPLILCLQLGLAARTGVGKAGCVSTEKGEAPSGVWAARRQQAPLFLFLSFNQRFMAGCEELPVFLRPRGAER